MNADFLLKRLGAIFFLSGFSALIYQVSWQRLLFSAFGVDLESITIIVAAFMFGLGVGAFFGGRLADRFPGRILLIFAAFEVSIGLAGLFSPATIAWARDIFSAGSPVVVAIANFSILIIPTFLMGATLPLLTTHVNKFLRNVGNSIGSLYFINTLGAAMGALITGFVLFNFMTINQTIYLAATVNFAAALFILLSFRKSP